MATAVTSQKLGSRLFVDMVDFDPDGTSKTAAIKASTWYDMRNHGAVLVKMMRTVGTSATTFEIQTSASSDGSNAVTVLSHAVGSEPDAVEDQLHLEVTASQCLEVLADARYIAAVISFATGTDEAVVTYVFGEPRFASDELTVDVVA